MVPFLCLCNWDGGGGNDGMALLPIDAAWEEISNGGHNIVVLSKVDLCCGD